MKIALRRATARGADPEAVREIAEQSGKSARTIYRVMGYPDDQLLQLDLADRLLLAAGGHLGNDCIDEGDVVDDG